MMAAGGGRPEARTHACWHTHAPRHSKECAKETHLQSIHHPRPWRRLHPPLPLFAGVVSSRRCGNGRRRRFGAPAHAAAATGDRDAQAHAHQLVPRQHRPAPPLRLSGSVRRVADHPRAHAHVPPFGVGGRLHWGGHQPVSRASAVARHVAVGLAVAVPDVPPRHLLELEAETGERLRQRQRQRQPQRWQQHVTGTDTAGSMRGVSGADGTSHALVYKHRTLPGAGQPSSAVSAEQPARPLCVPEALTFAMDTSTSVLNRQGAARVTKRSPPPRSGSCNCCRSGHRSDTRTPVIIASAPPLPAASAPLPPAATDSAPTEPEPTVACARGPGAGHRDHSPPPKARSTSAETSSLTSPSISSAANGVPAAHTSRAGWRRPCGFGGDACEIVVGGVF
jgi:hypothetical protein